MIVNACVPGRKGVERRSADNFWKKDGLRYKNDIFGRFFGSLCCGRSKKAGVGTCLVGWRVGNVYGGGFAGSLKTLASKRVRYPLMKKSDFAGGLKILAAKRAKENTVQGRKFSGSLKMLAASWCGVPRWGILRFGCARWTSAAVCAIAGRPEWKCRWFGRYGGSACTKHAKRFSDSRNVADGLHGSVSVFQVA